MTTPTAPDTCARTNRQIQNTKYQILVTRHRRDASPSTTTPTRARAHTHTSAMPMKRLKSSLYPSRAKLADTLATVSAFLCREMIMMTRHTRRHTRA